METKVAREQRVREDLDFGVELAHTAVVETTAGLNLVFSVNKFALELKVVLAGLQLRVRLSDSKDALEGRLHVVLGSSRIDGTLSVQ